MTPGTLSATVLDFKKFTRFEVDLYRGPNCALSITNVKVGKLPTSGGAPAKPHRDDPFGAPAKPHRDDPFGAPAKPSTYDPFGAPRR
jgi:hypothetical protein